MQELSLITTLFSNSPYQKGLCECFFNRPLELKKSIMKNSWFNANQISPFSQGSLFTIELDNPIVGFIISLSPCVSPSAIHGPSILSAFITMTTRVVSIIVDSVDRVTGWTRAHIAKKRNGIMPSGAEFYTPSSITLKVIILWVVASAFYIKPCIVNTIFALAVFPVCVAGNLSFSASARCGVTTSQGACEQISYLPAFTATAKKPSIVLLATQPKNCKSSKYPTGNIYKLTGYIDTLSTKEYNTFSDAHDDDGFIVSGLSLLIKDQPATNESQKRKTTNRKHTC